MEAVQLKLQTGPEFTSNSKASSSGRFCSGMFLTRTLRSKSWTYWTYQCLNFFILCSALLKKPQFCIKIVTAKQIYYSFLQKEQQHPQCLLISPTRWLSQPLMRWVCLRGIPTLRSELQNQWLFLRRNEEINERYDRKLMEGYKAKSYFVLVG